MEQQQTTLANLRPQTPAPIEHYSVGLTNSQGFELAQRAGKMLSTSTLVPKEYQGNLSNCIIALNMANRMGADPLMVMQNLVIVYGKPSWSSKFLIATVNTCGRFSALRFEYFGKTNTDEWGCRAWAIEKSTGEKLIGPDITIKLAKDEGWYGKNGSKWKTIPQKMLMYRAGGWWCDVYAPEISMGLRTEDENYDIVDIDKDGNVLNVTPAEQTTETLKRKRKTVEAEPATSTKPETLTDPETGEIKDTQTEDSEAGELSAEEMNEGMQIIEEITNLRENKADLILAKMKPNDVKKLDDAIDTFFAGFTMQRLKQYRDLLVSIK